MLGVPLQPIYEWIWRGLILNNIIIIGGVRHLAVIYTLYNKPYTTMQRERVVWVGIYHCTTSLMFRGGSNWYNNKPCIQHPGYELATRVYDTANVVIYMTPIQMCHHICPSLMVSGTLNTTKRYAVLLIFKLWNATIHRWEMMYILEMKYMDMER